MNLPNYITLIRICLAPLFFIELVSYKQGFEHHRWIALGIFAFAALTDALDGFLARVTSNQTELGRFLDPLADKLLLLSGYLGLLGVAALPFRPPLWITVTVVFRDLMIVIGLVIIYLINGSVRIQPNLLGKCTTTMQMFTLISILLMWPYSYMLWNIMAVLTILSFIVYFHREFSRLAAA